MKRKLFAIAALLLALTATAASAKTTYIGEGVFGPNDFPVRPIVVLPWGSVVVL